MILFTGLFLLVVGFVCGYQVAHLPKVKEFQRNRAIQQAFEVKPNEYTYYEEGVENSYILSLDDTEYRIKFSTNTPMTVVFKEELAPLGE
ncbi:hypothetical protein D929_02208 [Enterococcus faecalis 02-MB-P-10]|uniref:hypothetical protein n=1 Tax=Enterococcus faecalis TaxID=1351 RepID=UPI0003545262|nr:hypothetical protein [Enterococcus faecalis]EPH71321.1 hypothetical protein D929_02208 [Enterococcus faecalis 02-MB-P-10]